MKTDFSRVAFLIAACLAASFSYEAHAQTALLDYNFNQTGSTASNSGSISAADSALTLENSSGTATSLDTATGVAGSGDLAFNNTASTGMGSAGTGGVAVGSTAVGTDIGTLTSFTITGWFNVAATINNSANILNMFNNSTTNGIVLSAGDGVLTLQVNNGSDAIHSPYTTGYYGTGQWVYFAVTYNGTLSTNNVDFYWGTTSADATLVSGGTLTLANGSTSLSGAALGIGNTSSGAANRPFDGSLDDVELFGAASGSSGALTQTELEAVQSGDLLDVPEPGTTALICAGSALFLVCGWRRRRCSRIG